MSPASPFLLRSNIAWVLGDDDKTQDLVSTPDSTAREVHVGSQEKQEASGHKEGRGRLLGSLGGSPNISGINS